MFEGTRQDLNIGNREVQSLGSGRRHDMRRVSGQEQPAVLHGFDHEAAHARDAFLQDSSFGEFPSIRSQTDLKLLPDSFVTPRINVFIGLALQVQTANVRCSHAVQGKAAIMVGIDQFFGGGRSFSQNTEPSEGIFALIISEYSRRNAIPADAVKAIASGNEVTG